MKLTKKQEAEILSAYREMWDANIRGDIKTFSSHLDNRVLIFGTAEGEILRSKKEAREYYKATADQMTGKADFRNRRTTTNAYGNAIVVNELTDLYVLSGEDWIFYGHARVTGIFEQKGNTWKLVHMHGSFPDSRTEAGEQIATKKIKAENLQLREAVRRRTIELEEKKRELEIETALEKVRSVAMGMVSSEDMLRICTVISEQLARLGQKDIRNVQTAIFYPERGTFINYEYYARHNKTIITEVNYNAEKSLQRWARKLMQGANIEFYEELKGKKLREWYDYLQASNMFTDEYILEAKSLHYYSHSLGPVTLILSTYSPITQDESRVFKRFLNVFEIAYKRYLDIEKAHIQAKEAQTELALERVRAKVTAMMESKDLLEVVVSMRKEFVDLGHEAHYFWYMRWLPDRYEKAMTSGDGTKIGMVMTLPRHIHGDIPLVADWEKGTAPALVYPMDVDAAIAYVHKMVELGNFIQVDPQAPTEEDLRHINGLTFVMARTTQGEIGYSLPGFVANPPAADISTLIRFAGVFDLAYRRFEDLQDAEKRNRETQIELALEKVRSRGMGMQKSEELKEVIQVVYDQMTQLNLPVEHTGFILDYKKRNDYASWIADHLGSPSHIVIPYFDAPYYNRFNEAKREGAAFFSINLDFEQKNRFYHDLFKHLPGFPEDSKAFILEQPALTISTVLLDDVALYIENFSGKPYSAEQNGILTRFGKVFQQTYTRFLDLTKAEAQAKESQIQLALERVRARTMAMQRSEELPEVAALLFQQVKTLGVPQFHCGFNIFDIDDKECTWYPGSADGDILPPCKIPLTEHPVFIAFNESRKRGDELFVYEKEGEYQAGHYRYMLSLPVLGEILQHMLDAGIPFPTFQIDHVANFSHGNLLFITSEHFPEMHDTFKRFAKVFEQTYTRFLDLQKAEAQAREAQIEAALEKVRSRTMAMQSSDELADTAYALFEQLNVLGVTHERINIGIVNEENQTIDFWVTEQGGEKLNTKFSGRISEPTTLSKAYAAWKKGEKSIIIDLQGEALAGWLKFIYEEIKIPFNKAYLHNRRVQTIGFFSKGMLVLTSPEPLQDEALYLLEKFAGVFDLTYTRFSDLKIAEAHALQAEKDLQEIKAARQKAEKALKELKATQAQLVQQEKLASLGQLTAGIAHEIQNPLNFVNNFSEINAELSEEILEAASKGDIEEVKALAIDIKSNQEKIREHGKRADSIVKGMLQHSRSSTGTKEPTDIAALADEYLRLAYHGMRAKDKSFNASLQTAFEPNLPLVPSVAQDIGRVLLNLFNNAFYAVNERKKTGGDAYEPEVRVAVSKDKNRPDASVVITVSDNGPGIPESIKDKIFQPFFTTKPTGEGTGLGLSLSYDIVTKGHGGEISVQTKDGVGTTFIISLPQD